jgi:hypothetical protein
MIQKAFLILMTWRYFIYEHFVVILFIAGFIWCLFEVGSWSFITLLAVYDNFVG